MKNGDDIPGDASAGGDLGRGQVVLRVRREPKIGVHAGIGEGTLKLGMLASEVT